MKVRDLLLQKHMSVYRLSRTSGVPYATLSDICGERTRLEKCSAETVYRIARALDVSIESLLEPILLPRAGFENFKSHVCQKVRELGDIGYITAELEGRDIRIYYERQWYPECFYLLGMLDYLSRENGIPLCKDYDDLRSRRLEEPVYPSGVLALSAASGDASVLQKAREEAIPEFSRFNIIENEVRKVV